MIGNIIELRHMWTAAPQTGVRNVRYEGGYIHLQFRNGMSPTIWRDVGIVGVPVSIEVKKEPQ